MKKNNLFYPILAVLTLGLAPYVPEPHFFGKVKWVLGGAEGMGGMDYFDLVLHGAPWVYLIYTLISIAVKKFK
ncbi:hypothetical protein [Marivirga arenosa]|uniref:RND transporter n=1 Tax=Marivirga arenosa TaxID=3059076 RepID=A0AA51ZVF8_9BACT|nr:hypothetical protein [Marivirga sp. BKB1-2]WNB17475.1 hypothetical protein QYS47_34015 [Marivirga sp. BKB1-2]